ncbi:hypothetical protein V8F06_009497 [Rhypophila decipiens]
MHCTYRQALYKCTSRTRQANQKHLLLRPYGYHTSPPKSTSRLAQTLLQHTGLPQVATVHNHRPQRQSTELFLDSTTIWRNICSQTLRPVHSGTKTRAVRAPSARPCCEATTTHLGIHFHCWAPCYLCARLTDQQQGAASSIHSTHCTIDAANSWSDLQQQIPGSEQGFPLESHACHKLPGTLIHKERLGFGILLLPVLPHTIEKRRIDGPHI